VLEAIRRWNKRYGEPPTLADWEPLRARERGQEWRAKRFEAGDWPSTRMVRLPALGRRCPDHSGRNMRRLANSSC
jgi:hypothetical protein